MLPSSWHTLFGDTHVYRAYKTTGYKCFIYLFQQIIVSFITNTIYSNL